MESYRGKSKAVLGDQSSKPVERRQSELKESAKVIILNYSYLKENNVKKYYEYPCCRKQRQHLTVSNAWLHTLS